tara:strand:+ start:969 stop:1193 length:225 start_codon:yes stop_codon:yes gene_type:complete
LPTEGRAAGGRAEDRIAYEGSADWYDARRDSDQRAARWSDASLVGLAQLRDECRSDTVKMMPRIVLCDGKYGAV